MNVVADRRARDSQTEAVYAAFEHKLREYSKTSSSGRPELNNIYTILHRDIQCDVDPRQISDLGWGVDYYMRIFNAIESSGKISSLHFFISIDSPRALPKYGSSVVLFILGDERYLFRRYFYKIGCIFRCYTAWPPMPSLSYSLPMLVSGVSQYIRRFVPSFSSWLVLRLSRLLRWSDGEDIHSLPLGYFFHPGKDRISFRERGIGFSFAGSIEYVIPFPFDIRRILSPPKLISRRSMFAAIQDYLAAHPNSGIVKTTASFWNSVEGDDEYLDLLNRSKIVLCPRGNLVETFRFFEAAAAGCVIICEPLPAAWYYEKHPAIVLRNWRHVDKVLDRLLGDEQKLLEVANRTAAYWKDRVSEDAVAIYIEGKLTALSVKHRIGR